MADDNSHIGDLDPCLPEEYLKAFAEGKVSQAALGSAIEAHVGLCAQCAAKLRSLTCPKLSPDELMAKQLASLRRRQALLKQHHSQGPRLGTIWRTIPWTKTDPSGPLVFVLGSAQASQKNLLTVAEVSEDIPQAIATDMILDPSKSGLSFRCMVRGGNIFVMDPKDLETFCGELPQPLTQKVQEFSRLGEFFDERVPLSQIVLLQDLQGNRFMQRRGVVSGMHVSRKDDPRLRAAARGKTLCEHLHVAEPVAKKPESRRIDKHYLTSLLTGLVSELSMWGSLLIPPPPPKPAYAGLPATESASRRFERRSSFDPKSQESLSRSSSLSTSSDRPIPEPVKVEVKPGPTREEVRQRQPEQRQFSHGNQIKLSITAPEDGHLVIVHYCEQTGDLEIVFPVPEDQFPRVTSKQAIQIERKLVSPPGSYGFKVIFSRENLLPSRREKVPTEEGTLKDLMFVFERIEKLDEGAWREATFEYEIVKKKGFFSRLFS